MDVLLSLRGFGFSGCAGSLILIKENLSWPAQFGGKYFSFGYCLNVVSTPFFMGVDEARR